ncbi:epoxide hydrolase 4-like [Styela clava]|uniref:epoxide hydrolase 4-like n=1 Tax=Styela clava TaxID=7725 RepID=UPI00193AB0D1|nr:epoxide hydrolase 4-like [Styela clava]
MAGFKDFVVKLIAAIVIVGIASFWSCFVIASVLYSMISHGPRKVLYFKNRKKESAPIHYIAWDEETRKNPGPSTKPWDHAYITVPETRMRFHYVYSGKKPNNVAISDIDGETIIVDEPSLAGTKPKLILCLHGFPENWFSWRHVLRYFDNPPPEVENHFVVAIDLRGYGDSDKPKSSASYHLNNLVSDVRGIAHALGYEKFVLMGHDWGGMIAFNVAKIYPEILEKCIILNVPYTKAYYDVLKKNPGQFLKSWYMFFYQLPFLPEWLFRLSDYRLLGAAFNGNRGGIRNRENRLTDEELEVFKYSVRHSTSGPINFYRANVWPFYQPGPTLLYPRIRSQEKPLYGVPILLIWGNKDAFLTKELADISGKYFNPDNGSKVVFVEGASHWVQQDAPKEAMKNIVEFLK